MKIILVPALANEYDRRMVSEFSHAFRVLGHQAIFLNRPIINDSELVFIMKEFKFDVVLQINKPKPECLVSYKNVRHISWYQDIFPSTQQKGINFEGESDLIYTLGDPSILGLTGPFQCPLSQLATGVDRHLFEYRDGSMSEEHDLSLCGFIPPPYDVNSYDSSRELAFYFGQFLLSIPIIKNMNILELYRAWSLGGYLPPQYQQILISMVELTYERLSGNLDVMGLARKMEIFLENKIKYDKKYSVQKNYLLSKFAENHDKRETIIHSVPKIIDYLTREYPRLLDREFLGNLALSVTKSVAFYGPGWSSHEKFANYAKGLLINRRDLLNVYQSTKLNLSNNTHGLGLHSRILECMAVGGVVMMHDSPNDYNFSGMKYNFEPGEDYICYNSYSFCELAAKNLMDQSQRKKIQENCSKKIYQNHLWENRVNQIIADLERE